MTDIKFQAIKVFVQDLNEMYHSENHPLALYNRLLQKTTIEHTDAVGKHINAFALFCSTNNEIILNNGIEFKSVIQYSPKVYIDMTEIFRLVGDDTETKTTIDKHLLLIASLLDPQCGAKNKLKEITPDKSTTLVHFDGGSKEDDFLNDIINKVEKIVVQQDTDQLSAQDAFSKVLNSGLVNEIVAGIGKGTASGTLDLSKMVSTLQKTISDINTESDPQINQMMNMINMFSTLPSKNNI
jgi:hypothetical protein